MKLFLLQLRQSFVPLGLVITGFSFLLFAGSLWMLDGSFNIQFLRIGLLFLLLGGLIYLVAPGPYFPDEE